MRGHRSVDGHGSHATRPHRPRVDPGPSARNGRGRIARRRLVATGSRRLRTARWSRLLGHVCNVDRLEPENELCIRFAALDPVLAGKRPRPRWKNRLARNSNIRWIRTTLLGRMDGWAGWAAPVGPGARSSSSRAAPPRGWSRRASTCAATGGDLLPRDAGPRANVRALNCLVSTDASVTYR